MEEIQGYRFSLVDILRHMEGHNMLRTGRNSIWKSKPTLKEEKGKFYTTWTPEL